ncbi:DUF6602 domain-containing protein [Demequina aurantiaca]|uniref:DUF6602 domain-containing protein n=1 Tax=Demequina aurantiaca TaxID=676200 RepID=UPI003D337CBC
MVSRPWHCTFVHTAPMNTSEQLNGRDTVGDLLGGSQEMLWASFEKSRNLNHSGTKGTAREAALRTFLREQLPTRFGVGCGEIIDAGGSRTSQMDVIIYDQHSVRPIFVDSEGAVIVAAESVYAVVEVKSTLSASETAKAIRGLSTVRNLRPWGQEWARYQSARSAMDSGPRCFTSIFAYESDLSPENWSKKELERFRLQCDDQSYHYEYVERLAVLSRGIVLPAEAKVAIPGEKSSVLGSWFHSLRSFMAREVGRRKEFPLSQYQPEEKWLKVGKEVFRAPTPSTYSRTQRRKYLRRS